MGRALSALAAILLGATAAEAAACATTDACLAAVREAQRNLESMTADFVQVKYVQLLDEPVTSRGKLSFRRPDRMRLEIEEPVRSTVLIRGREIHIPGVSESDRRAMAAAPAAAMFTQLGAVFTGDTEKLGAGFDVTAAGAGDDVEVTLVPRPESWRTVWRRMQITFGGSDLMARQIRLDDALGDRLEIRLQNVKRNVDLPESTFAPEGGPAS